MTDYRVRAGDIEEDQVTSLIESYSAQLPSSFYLGAAGVSIVASLIAKLQGRDHAALFFGQWAAPFLLLRLPDAVRVRERLRELGYAVRRADTFPGLGPDWLRIAVRDRATTDGFVSALDSVRAELPAR